MDPKNLTIPILEEQEGKPLPEKKKILLGQTILSSIVLGSANFLYGMIQGQDFAVTCLSWTGFFLISFIFKFFELRQVPNLTKSMVFDNLFGQLRNKENFIHLLLRSLNFYAYILFTMAIFYYAKRAQINFGIIMSIMSLEIVLQTLYGYLFFNEKLKWQMLLGIGIVISGVVWISISKSTPKTQSDGDILLTDDEIYESRLIAVGLTIMLSLISSMRPLQAKYLNKKTGYPGFQFAIDGAIFCGIFLFLFSCYYFIIGAQSYTSYNIWISFAASSLIMIFSILGMNAIVKGLAGPTMAVIQTHSMTSTILGVIFLGLVPNINQISAMIIIILGCIIILVM